MTTLATRGNGKPTAGGKRRIPPPEDERPPDRSGPRKGDAQTGPSQNADASASTAGRTPGGRAAAAVAGTTLRALTRAMIGLARVRSVGRDEVLRVKASGRPIVLVSWHGYDLCNLGVYPVLYGRESRAVIMAPTTWEGRVMEQLVSGFGYDVVPVGVDPTSRVSVRGVVEMASRIRQGCDGMIAVDGPFGPPEMAKLGAAVIAKRASAVIVPTVVAGSREFRIRRRWDRHLLIPPFARMLVHFGPLIDTCPRGEDPPPTEEIRERMETALRESALRAHAMVHEGGGDG